MRGYNGLELPSSSCVRFVRNTEIDGSERAIFDELRQRNIRSVYVDLSADEGGAHQAANLIAIAAQLDNAPYETKEWLCLSDDMTTLAYREAGLVIVVDNAWVLVDKRKDELFDLVEAFLSQFHHWFEQSKPCHLCLQMEPNKIIKSLV